MRLLCVEQKTVWGGGQVALINLLHEWQATHAPIEPRVLCPPASGLESRVRALKIPFEIFDPGAIVKTRGLVWNLSQRVRPTARLLGILRRTRTEVVLANGAFAFLASAAAAKLMRVPIVWFEHNTTLPSDAILRRMIDWADHIVVVSTAIKAQFLTLVPSARSKITVIHNGADTNQFEPRPMIDDGEWQTDTPQKGLVVGTVSRLSPEKGVGYFVEAASEILRELPDTRFLVVGDGPLRNELEGRAPHQQMRFVGAQSDVAAWLNRMDIFVLSSLAEGFPLAIAEAMACELPVVASDVGGVFEIVVQGETGMRVPPGDAHALAGAVLELLRDDAKRERFGRAGRKRVQDLFTVELQARAMANVLQTMVLGG